LLLVGDDWAEEHHDVELQDETGRRLAWAKLPEGVVGIARLHAMIGEHLGEGHDAAQVVVGIETDRGPWVAALIAAGYQIYAINPLQVARFRERHAVSGGKSDTADAHVLADMVRTDRHQLRAVAGDSELSEAAKVVTRAHKTLIWEQTRHRLRLRSTLREYFPAALAAFEDLTAPDVLELLALAPDPVAAAGLSNAQITTALRKARRRRDHGEGRRDPHRAGHRAAGPTRDRDGRLRRDGPRAGRDPEHPQHRDHHHARPGRGLFRPAPGRGDLPQPTRSGTDPRRPGPRRVRRRHHPLRQREGPQELRRDQPHHPPVRQEEFVMARYVHNDRLIDALGRQAFCSLTRSPGTRAYYDQLRHRGIAHNAALRQLGNRFVGILHGCLKTSTRYDEATARPTPPEHAA
jgi:transposase